MEAHDRVTDLIPHLRRYARALGTSEISSDELVRATLERAQAQLDRYSPEADLRIWLFSLMHHSYIAQLRGAEAAAELEPEPGTSAEPQLDGKPLSLRDFERAMASLPPSHREIFLLVTLEDMSYQDVARALEIPIGTVMSRLSRAREKLRLLLMSQAGLRLVR
jgi:RNA polymerase sigma-70 factor (ECF subfamily)